MLCGVAAMAFILVTSLAVSGITSEKAYASGAKQTVWVLVKSKNEMEDLQYTSTYTYTKKGLVKKSKEVTVSDGERIVQSGVLSYDSKGRPTGERSTYNGKANGQSAFTLDAKGRVVKSVWRSTSGYTSTMTYRYNAKGQLKGLKGNKYRYDAIGDLTKVTEPGLGSYYFEYDDKGNVVKRSWKYAGGVKELEYTYKNIYKGKRLMKVKRYSHMEDTPTLESTTVFRYKKLSVPKSMVKLVKAQQASLFNAYLPLVAAHK